MTEYKSKTHMTLPNGDVINEGEYGISRCGQLVGPLTVEEDCDHLLNMPWAEGPYFHHSDGRSFLDMDSDDIVAKVKRGEEK